MRIATSGVGTYIPAPKEPCSTEQQQNPGKDWRVKILLTNDDGGDSPLFLFAIRVLRPMGDLKVVVPASEQSWTGKSMTRLGRLDLTETSHDGVIVNHLSGTPADCANFGVYHLFDGKPDLVVSGINAGSNIGVSFVFSSGTVGACLEANIAGVPGIAFSQILGPGVFKHWSTHRRFPDEEGERLEGQAQAVMTRVFEELMPSGAPPEEPLTWSANIPPELAQDWSLAHTALGHTFYQSCFKPKDGGYHHNIERPEIDAREETDGQAVMAGNVSLTRLDIRGFGQLDG